MASKMFNTYSKMVALEFLWSTLSLMMYELNQMGKSKESESEHSSSILLNSSLEVLFVSCHAILTVSA